MAAAKEAATSHVGTGDLGFVAPKAQSNLNAVYPLWSPGPNVSIKTAKEGYKANPIHGTLLGVVDLPSQQLDEEGHPQDWKAIVIELKQKSYAKAPDEEEARIYEAGSRIAMTVTSTLERMVAFAENPNEVLEACIYPEVKLNKRKQTMWVFPKFDNIAVTPRQKVHSISASSVFKTMGHAPTAPSLGSGGDAPFANGGARA